MLLQAKRHPKSVPLASFILARLRFHGQGAAEYLVLVAIALVLAVTAILLLSSFSDSSFETRSRQSDAYWRGMAHPFSIAEHGLFSNGTLVMVVANTEPDSLRIDSIRAAGNGLSGAYSGQKYIGPGERVLLSMDFGSNFSAGEVYEFDLNISYERGDSLARSTQFGSAPLVGRVHFSAVAEPPSSPPTPPPSPPPSDLPNGASCSNPNECASHHCWGGTCVECTGNGHCAARQRCVNNACVG